MDRKLRSAKPPLSKSNKNLKDSFPVQSPRSIDIPLEPRKLPPLTPKSRPSHLANVSLKLDELYEKIQSYESPKSTPKVHAASGSFSATTNFIIRTQHKTPSPKNSQNSEGIYTDWDVHEALKAPRIKNIGGKRKTLIGALKSF